MRNAIVFGATSGIGKALTNLLLLQEYQVMGLARRIELLKTFVNEYPHRFQSLRLDVLEKDSFDYCLEKIFDFNKRIDLVINCIGIGELNEQLNWDIDASVLRTNILATTRIYNEAFIKFKQQGFGHLVAISSIGGLRGNEIAPSYSASKAYQINYIESLYLKTKEKGCKNIDITDVRPGFVNTRMAKGDGLFWVADVDKVAGQIIRAINHKKRLVYVTKRWKLIAWVFKIVPSWFLKKIS